MDTNLAQAVTRVLGLSGPEALNHADAFRGLLQDYYPEVNKLKAAVLADSVRLGIAGLIVQASGRSIEHGGYLEMQRILQDRPGVGELAAREVVDFWLNYAGKTVLDPICEPMVETPKIQLVPPTKPQVLFQPRLAVSDTIKERTWLEKVMIYTGIFAVVGVMMIFFGLPKWAATPIAMGIAACIFKNNKCA